VRVFDEENHDAQYGYADGLNRLTAATETIGNTTFWTQAYSYDDYGNRAVTSSDMPNSYATPTAKAGLNLKKALATEQQMGEILSGTGNIIAGPERG